MKYLLFALAVLMFAPVVTLKSHPHPPIRAMQVVSGIDHQQPTGDPEPPPHEKYPGQLQHALPPEDYFCKRQDITLSVDQDHACTCERMFDPDDPTVVREDTKCNSWCHMEHCSCGIGGSKPDGVPAPLR